MTSYELSLKQKAALVNGPTTDQQSAFDWAAFPMVPHRGLAQVFNYTFETVGITARLADSKLLRAVAV